MPTDVSLSLGEAHGVEQIGVPDSGGVALPLRVERSAHSVRSDGPSRCTGDEHARQGAAQATRDPPTKRGTDPSLARREQPRGHITELHRMEHRAAPSPLRGLQVRRHARVSTQPPPKATGGRTPPDERADATLRVAGSCKRLTQAPTRHWRNVHSHFRKRKPLG